MKTPVVVGALLAGLVLPAVGHAQMGYGSEPGRMGSAGMMGGPGMMGGSRVRRIFVMRNGVDPTYAQTANPLPPTAENLRAGRELYEQNCAACHGLTGLGDGPAGKNLDPPPASLVGVARMPMVSDGYLYWTIAEGGAPLQTAMPAFKAALGARQIWQLVLLLRGL